MQGDTRHVPIPDGKLEIETLGAGEPLLLVAGLGGRRQFWREQQALLAEHFFTVLHDHRGTGGSSPWAGPFSIAQMAGDVVALMDALELDQARFVGHSTGGAIGQHLALHCPERFTQIVLSSTWAGPDPYFDALFDVRKSVLSNCGVDAYLTDGTLRATPPGWLAKRPDFLANTRAERRAAFPGVETELARIDAVCAHDLRAQLKTMQHNVSIAVAADDQITPRHLSEELYALIPGASLSVLESGGHFVPLTEPGPYNDFLLSTVCGDKT